MNQKNIKTILLNILLAGLLAFGIWNNFRNMRWDDDALLHPDEYGLTNTLTQLRMPNSIANYFNTRISSMSPYNKYDENGETIANGPDNTMRWGQLPMLIIRLTAEALNRTGFIELRTTGRYLSALMNLGSMIMLYVIARRLFGHTTALLAAALFSLCVQALQQAHFMTVDNFATFFTMLTLNAALRIAFGNYLSRDAYGTLRMSRKGWIAMARFGLCLGLTICCKVNLAMLGVILAPAVLICFAETKLVCRKDFSRVIALAAESALMAIVVMVFACRVFQPMMFRASSGNTSFFTFALNPDWVRSMNVAATESKGIGGGPPSEQWAHRPAFFFAWINQVLWGMGLPLGIAVWAFLIMAWVFIFRSKEEGLWKKLLLPAFWATLFFLFMSTRFVKNNRYFLPTYPSFCLMAAWGLATWYRRSRKTIGRVLCCLTGAVVLGGTFVWTYAFMNTVYGQTNTRVEATNRIYDNIPSLFQLANVEDGTVNAAISIPADETETLYLNAPLEKRFRPYRDAEVNTLKMPKARALGVEGTQTVTLSMAVFLENTAGEPIWSEEAQVELTAAETALEIPVTPFALEKDKTYWLRIGVKEGPNVTLRRIAIATENWDEGLPFRARELDPYGQLYTGITNEVRSYDTADKIEMFMDVLTRADYLILPSQRGIWSVCRIPRTYPMTIAYYQALFDGSLGFKLADAYQRPIKIGPFYISDLAGTITTEYPELPVVNLSSIAAEEAFSVYDHAPVWIFEKTEDFSMEKLREFFESFDLTQVVIQGPADAEWEW